MIYVHEINIDNKALWGGAQSATFVLPGAIRKIKRVMANVIVGDNSYLKREFADLTTYTDADGNIVNKDAEGAIAHPAYYIGGYESVQIGVVSLSLNDDIVIISGMPANATCELLKTSFNDNMRALGTSVEVKSGSIMRAVIEEKMISPFVTKADLEEGGEAFNQAYGSPSVVTNNYSVKIYIDYE